MAKIFVVFLAVILSIIACTNSENKESKMKHPSIVNEEFIYEINDALTPQCHASTIAESGGVLVASWFGGTEEKNDDVGIWVSRKVDGAWSSPVEVANGIQADGSRYPSWNPVLFKPKNNPLMLFYIVGRMVRCVCMYLVYSESGFPRCVLNAMMVSPLQMDCFIGGPWCVIVKILY